MHTLKVFNKTGNKWIKFRMEMQDIRTLWNLLAKYGYGFVLSADEEEGDNHGYKDNIRR